MTDNEKYEEALKVVASAEKAILVELSTVNLDINTYLNEKLEELRSFKTELPVVPGATSNIRTSLDSLVAQIESYASQTRYMNDNLNSIAQQYLATSETANPSPMMTPPGYTGT